MVWIFGHILTKINSCLEPIESRDNALGLKLYLAGYSRWTETAQWTPDFWGGAFSNDSAVNSIHPDKRSTKEFHWDINFLPRQALDTRRNRLTP